MMKRILGKVTKEIADKNNISEYANKKIVLYDNDRRHCAKHKEEFGDIKTFHYVMDNLEDIIANPDYVFYVKNKNTLEYYKIYGFGITVRVKVEPGNELKVKTVFTVTKNKIDNRIKREAYNKYVVN
nr:MAG TPA: nuclease [Caudoviricetes sp.]